MFCRRCGERQHAHSERCLNCGTPFPAPQRVEPIFSDERTTVALTPEAPTQSARQKSDVLIIALGVAACFLLAAALMVYIHTEYFREHNNVAERVESKAIPIEKDVSKATTTPPQLAIPPQPKQLVVPPQPKKAQPHQQQQNSLRDYSRPKNYTDAEKHRLFQAVGMTKDEDLILRVSREIGIINDDNSPNRLFQPFLDEHMKWALTEPDFVRLMNDRRNARNYVLLHLN
ncbi:MAG TPA: hypothetical protein VGB73_16320 [Pyrinomonadaceae bacterium]|jgi:hypothetical protein